MFPEKSCGSHDFVEGPSACSVFAVEIVKFTGAIYAESNEEIVLSEEPAPLVVKQDAVGLEGVFDVGARFPVFFLKLHGSPEKIESHKRWLAALPCDGYPRGPVKSKELADIGLVDPRRHPKIASRIELFLLQEKTVAATQIAGRTRRLGHYMKGFGIAGRTRRLGRDINGLGNITHCHVFSSNTKVQAFCI